MIYHIAIVAVILAVFIGLAYLAACAGADRWLTFREWLGN